MSEFFKRVGYLVVPATFLIAAFFFFKTDSNIAGGVCIFVAFLTARN